MGETCAKCGKPAAFNFQKLWVKWTYDSESGEYSQSDEFLLDIEPADWENLFYCKKCSETWEKGELS